MNKSLIVSFWDDDSPLPIDINSYDKIIAVDCGANLCKKYRITPDIIIGDFDSINPDVLNFFSNTKKIQFSPKKNFTDSELAIDWCKNNGCYHIDFINNLNGRADHSLSMISLLLFAEELKIKMVIFSKNEFMLIIPKIYKTYVKKGIFSLLPLTENVENVSITGAKYLLKNNNMKMSRSLGLSNETISDKLEISYKTGKLLFIAELGLIK